MNGFATQPRRIGLYSPPHFKRRLPSEEPRPQQGKSMTISAGFRCRDGVLLLVDSQHSAGQTKYQGPKVWTLPCGDETSSLILTAAGSSSSIADTVDAIQSAIGKLTHDVTLKNIKDVLRRINPGEGNVLLLGVQIQNEDKSQLLRVEQDSQGNIRINQLDDFRQKYFFTGTEVSEAMCHEMFEFFPVRSMGVLQMREIGKHILGRICEYSEWCSRPIQSAYILDYEFQLEGFEDFQIPDYKLGHEGYLFGVPRLLGNAIHQCLDYEETKESAFEKCLQNLIDKLREIRRKAKGAWIVLD